MQNVHMGKMGGIVMVALSLFCVTHTVTTVTINERVCLPLNDTPLSRFSAHTLAWEGERHSLYNGHCSSSFPLSVRERCLRWMMIGGRSIRRIEVPGGNGEEEASFSQPHISLSPPHHCRPLLTGMGNRHIHRPHTVIVSLLLPATLAVTPSCA